MDMIDIDWLVSVLGRRHRCCRNRRLRVLFRHASSSPRHCHHHRRVVSVFINLRLFGIGHIYADDVFLWFKVRRVRYGYAVCQRSHHHLLIGVVHNYLYADGDFLCVSRGGPLPIYF